MKSFDYEAKEDWKAVLQPENKWLERREELLVAAREFYVNQVLIRDATLRYTTPTYTTHFVSSPALGFLTLDLYVYYFQIPIYLT